MQWVLLLLFSCRVGTTFFSRIPTVQKQCLPSNECDLHVWQNGDIKPDEVIVEHHTFTHSTTVVRWRWTAWVSTETTLTRVFSATYLSPKYTLSQMAFLFLLYPSISTRRPRCLSYGLVWAECGLLCWEH
jgi:hypothetical protein